MLHGCGDLCSHSDYKRSHQNHSQEQHTLISFKCDCGLHSRTAESLACLSVTYSLIWGTFVSLGDFLLGTTLPQLLLQGAWDAQVQTSWPYACGDHFFSNPLIFFFLTKTWFTCNIIYLLKCRVWQPLLKINSSKTEIHTTVFSP